MKNLRLKCLWCGRMFNIDEGIIIYVFGQPYPFCSEACMTLWSNFFRDQEEEFIAALEDGEDDLQ